MLLLPLSSAISVTECSLVLFVYVRMSLNFICEKTRSVFHQSSSSDLTRKCTDPKNRVKITRQKENCFVWHINIPEKTNIFVCLYDNSHRVKNCKRRALPYMCISCSAVRSVKLPLTISIFQNVFDELYNKNATNAAFHFCNWLHTQYSDAHLSSAPFTIYWKK